LLRRSQIERQVWYGPKGNGHYFIKAASKQRASTMPYIPEVLSICACTTSLSFSYMW